MSGDMQMAIVRGGDPAHNFAVGEPHVLGSLVKSHFLEKLTVDFDLHYPLLNGSPRLIEAIQNSPYQNGKYVVVANGAKQAISAAMYAYKASGADSFLIPKPYWPSFPTLAQLAGLNFVDHSGLTKGTMRCIASPNNPDGFQLASGNTGNVDIWDAAYASPSYGWNGVKPQVAHCTVHSASKLFGLSGLRVGWLSTDNEELASKAAFYVEKTTSGMSSISQAAVLQVLNYTQSTWHRTTWSEIQNKMWLNTLSNAESVCHHLTTLCDKVEVPTMDYGQSNVGSMFAWLKPRNYARFMNAVKRAGLSVVDGEHCGRFGWTRISLGNSILHTERAAKHIKDMYNE